MPILPFGLLRPLLLLLRAIASPDQDPDPAAPLVKALIGTLAKVDGLGEADESTTSTMRAMGQGSVAWGQRGAYREGREEGGFSSDADEGRACENGVVSIMGRIIGTNAAIGIAGLASIIMRSIARGKPTTLKSASVWAEARPCGDVAA